MPLSLHCPDMSREVNKTFSSLWNYDQVRSCPHNSLQGRETFSLWNQFWKRKMALLATQPCVKQKLQMKHKKSNIARPRLFCDEKESMKRWDGGCIDQVCTCLGSLLQRQLPACIETRISRKRAKTSLQKFRFWALADLAGWRLYKLRVEGVQRVSNQSKRCWRHVLCQPSNKAFQEREYFPTFQLSNRPVTDVHGPPAVLPPWNNLRFDWSNVCQA